MFLEKTTYCTEIFLFPHENPQGYSKTVKKYQTDGPGKSILLNSMNHGPYFHVRYNH